MPDASQIAIQLYTVRRLLADDFEGTLAALAEIGFRQLEAFDLPAFGARLATAAPAQGLTIPSAHAGILDGNLESALAAADELGIGLLVQPWTEPARWETADGIAAIAAELNEAAMRAAPTGVRIGYHNHHFELSTIVEGRHGLEVLVDHLDPGVAIEIDAYWAYAGGADVPALVRRLGSRVVALHVKDGDGSLDASRQVAAGAGVVPLGAVIEAAPDALRIVELDETAGDLLKAVRASHAFLAGLANA